MNLTRLHHFAIALEEGCIRDAAERLNVTCKQLETEIDELAKEVGATLLEPGSMRPTQAGQILFAGARRIRSLMGELTQVAAWSGRNPSKNHAQCDPPVSSCSQDERVTGPRPAR